jgi:hypothetical protein
MDGDEEGATLGDVVVGDALGASVGDTVGDEVLGDVVGDTDGDEEGATLGDMLGASVGDTLGDVVVPRKATLASVLEPRPKKNGMGLAMMSAAAASAGASGTADGRKTMQIVTSASPTTEGASGNPFAAASPSKSTGPTPGICAAIRTSIGNRTTLWTWTTVVVVLSKGKTAQTPRLDCADVVGDAVDVGSGVVGDAVDVGSGVVGDAVDVGSGVVGDAVDVGTGVVGDAVDVGGSVSDSVGGAVGNSVGDCARAKLITRPRPTSSSAAARGRMVTLVGTMACLVREHVLWAPSAQLSPGIDARLC